MAAVDCAALAALRCKRNVAVACAAVAIAAAAAAFLAVVLGGRSFGVFRLAAYGVFLHGTVLLAGSAWLLWRPQRKTALAAAATAVLLAGIGVDAFLIEPHWLEVSHVRLTSAKISRPVRIVVVADLQTDEIGRYEKQVFRRVLQEQPDLILLAGDYIQAGKPLRGELHRQLNELLREIEFPGQARAFAVLGNVDPPDWTKSFENLGVTMVRSTESFELPQLRLTCLAMLESRDRSLKIGHDDSSRFHLVLGHLPNFALGQVQADLLVAGHTHGGQVRLPLLGPLLKLSPIPRSWAAGLTDLPGGGKLLVSRGIGMERHGAPRLRFLCRPELVVIDLVPQGE